MNKIIGIHQPNFFPWLGYFNKMFKSDVFIIMDDVALPKTGGTWSNRVRILINGKAQWLTVPMQRKSGEPIVSEMEFSPDNIWRQKILKTLESNYRKSPYYKEAAPLLFPLIENPEQNIARYNIHLTKMLADVLTITTPILFSSDTPSDKQSNERLIELVHRANGDIYLYGGGADGYQEEAAFEAAGIKMKAQNFLHPTYPQHQSQDFTPGLSIIDSLMNNGINKTAELIRTA